MWTKEKHEHRTQLLEKCIHNHVYDMKPEELVGFAVKKLLDHFHFAETNEIDKFINENQYKPF
jgi:hypothetical protein